MFSIIRLFLTGIYIIDMSIEMFCVGVSCHIIKAKIVDVGSCGTAFTRNFLTRNTYLDLVCVYIPKEYLLDLRIFSS